MPKGWKEQSSYTSVPKRSEEKTQEQEAESNTESSEMNRLEIFIPEEPQHNLDDLVVSLAIRMQIEVALNQIHFHDILYYQWNLQKVDRNGRRVAINLFGPPGTGKSFCAEAIAKHLGKRLIKVNYAEIESKYVGETPKNITAAFEKAHETDSAIFFDEADSILGKRLTNVTQSADHGVNVSRSVMLLQLDKFDGVVIFASNLPGNYDGAFVRRILAHVEFELPDLECRAKLWSFLLPVEVPRDEDISIEWLAEQSSGLSGGDILSIVKLAASQAVARTGDKQKVSRTDVTEAIAQVKNSKHRVGRESNGNREIAIEEKNISIDELPPDARLRYESAISH